MTMKNNLPKILAAVLAGCFAVSVHAQLPADGRPNDTRVIVNPEIGRPTAPGVPAARQETRFDLNFKGGTPKQFIEAINAQSGLKVNVIVSTEHTNASLPSIEVHNATIPQVFEAITAHGSGTRGVTRNTTQGRIEYAAKYTKGFSTNDKNPSEDSIWYFLYESPTSDPDPLEPASVQIFQLASLLEGHSIDDISTAIKTAWGMLDTSTTPELKYHSETNLLIVKGTGSQLAVVTQVLARLGDGNKTRQLPIPTGLKPPAH